MLVAPARRCTLIARLRRVAITAGPPLVRIWEWSSSKTTSRIQCSRFSMLQCQPMISASCSARISPQLRSVTAYTVSVCQRPLAGSGGGGSAGSRGEHAGTQSRRPPWRASESGTRPGRGPCRGSGRPRGPAPRAASRAGRAGQSSRPGARCPAGAGSVSPGRSPNRACGEVGRRRGGCVGLLFRRPLPEPDVPDFRGIRLSSAHHVCREALPL
jgi:hypothetical protein